MRMSKYFTTAIILVFMLTLGAFEKKYTEVNDRVITLEEENNILEESLEASQDASSQLESYLLDHEGEVFSFEEWEKASEISQYFYKDSDESFSRLWGAFLALQAKEKGIDPFLVYELLKVETGGKFDPQTIGPATRYGHAYGIAQFMENTAPWIAGMAGLNYQSKEDLYDPYFSIQLAITYLDFLYNQYGDWDYALTAYHRGMGGLETYINNNGHAKSDYAVRIQKNAEARELVAYGKKN